MPELKRCPAIYFPCKVDINIWLGAGIPTGELNNKVYIINEILGQYLFYKEKRFTYIRQ
jgi:hypothetical protein